MGSVEDIRKGLERKKIILGTDRVIKNLKLGKIVKVYLSSNCPDDVKEEVKRYKVEVVELKQPNDELGALCKKQFSVSVLGVSR